jgi:hypothetical protein
MELKIGTLVPRIFRYYELKKTNKILSKYDICYTDEYTYITLVPTTLERILLAAT